MTALIPETRCTAVAAIDIAASEDLLLAGFAAVQFRYTGQNNITVHRGSGSLRFAVTGSSTLSTLTGEPGPSTPDGAELRLDGAELHYDANRFDGATIARLLGHVRTLIEDATRNPDRPVALLRLLPDAEARRVLVDWNRTETPLPHDICLHQAFEARAAQAPEAIAVVHGGLRWTYGQINADANQLAERLRSVGVGPGTRVGLSLDRSPELLVAVLGIMKAGGAYVPLDPAYPAERLAAMVAGTSCAVMISRAGVTADPPAHHPHATAGPDNLCYLIHTSGSTGAPKPIALRHRGVMNNLADLNSRFGIGPGDSVLALSSPSFDMSVYEFLGITAAGGTVVIPDADRAKDPAHWAELIAAERVTIWNSAPALLGLLTDHLEQTGARSLLSLRLAMLGGDWVPVTLPDRIRTFAPGLRFIVMGGATEASIHSTIYEVEATDPGWTSIPYGRPMANQRTYILDDELQPVPPGVAGELYLAGIGLARGYLDQPERTAERFIEWSYGEVADRLYRTGDLARFGPDGLIELLGRTDFQVKINGLRVELGEIEAVLRDHPGVRQVAVAAKADRLTAYLVPRGPTLDTAELRELVARKLPEFMVPAAFVQLDQLPLTPNGKLDRKGLPEPEVAGFGYRAPGSATERALAEVYAEVLGLPRVGVDDDFIAIGGDSVRAIQVVTRARNRGIGITAREVLQLRTIAAIAPAAGAPADSSPTAVLGAEWPLTPMQSGMLFESIVDGSYQLQTVYHLAGEVDADRLRAVGPALLERHPGLRAAFVGEPPVQVVVDGVEPAWREVDLRNLSESERDAAFEAFLATDRAELFDPATAPLLRLALVRFGAGHSRLVLTAHHVLLDGWSERLLANDIVRLYAGAPLPPAPGFGDFLAWLERRDRVAGARAWARELEGSAPTTLAPARASQARADIRELRLPLAPGELVSGAEGVTANTVVQSAWALMLAALTGRDDVVFGATVSGRPGELPGVESMVGLFINTIPVRVRVSPQETAGGLLTDVQRRQVALLDHQHHGLTDLHQALGVEALFDTLVVFQSFGPECAIRVDSIGTGSYPLTLIVEAGRLTVQYDQNLFERATVEDIAARFRRVARQLSADPARRIGSLDGLPAALVQTAVSLATNEPEHPRTAREAELCALFADVLGVDQVGVDDNLFALGCNSLKATRIISRIRQNLGLEASIRTIFQYPTIAQLADRITTPGSRPSLHKWTAT